MRVIRATPGRRGCDNRARRAARGGLPVCLMPDFNAFDLPDPTVPAAASPSDEAPPRARLARRAPRQSRARRLTEQVLNATAEVLVRRGHAGLSTNSVAAQAGVSVGALYQYFPDKAALLAAVRERHARAMGQALLAAWADAAPTRLDTAVQALVRGLFAAHALEPTLHDRLEQDGPLVATLPSHPDGVVCRVPCEASATPSVEIHGKRDSRAAGASRKGLACAVPAVRKAADVPAVASRKETSVRPGS